MHTKKAAMNRGLFCKCIDSSTQALHASAQNDTETAI